MKISVRKTGEKKVIVMRAKRQRVPGLLRGARNYGIRTENWLIYPAKLKVARTLANKEVARRVLECKRDFAKLPKETLLGKAWTIHITKAFPKVLQDEAYRVYTNLAANYKESNALEYVVQFLAEAKALGYLQ